MHARSGQKLVKDSTGSLAWVDKDNKLVQNNSSSRDFVCSVCDKRYMRRCDWKRHVDSHSNPTVQCECGAVFKRSDAMYRHAKKRGCK